MHPQPKQILLLEAYEDGEKAAEEDVTDYSPEAFVDLLDIQDMLGRECELKVGKERRKH